MVSPNKGGELIEKANFVEMIVNMVVNTLELSCREIQVKVSHRLCWK